MIKEFPDFEKFETYIQYLIAHRFYLYDLEFHGIESKVVPPNHVYKNDLLKQPGVKIFTTLGVITQPVYTKFPTLDFESFCKEDANITNLKK